MSTIPGRKKAQIYEDQEFIINKPYGATKEIFNTQRFNVKIFKENGEKPFVVIREKNEDLSNM